MAIEIEGLRVSGLSIRDFLKEDFVEEMDRISPDIDVVALVMMKKNGKKAMSTPIIFNHQSAEEIKSKTLHLDCSDAKTLEMVKKMIEKRMGGGNG